MTLLILLHISKSNQSARKLKLLLSIMLPVFFSCHSQEPSPQSAVAGGSTAIHRPQMVVDIPLPAGYSRIPGRDTAFAAWLRKVRIRNNKWVYLYNGELKRNQQAQYAVLDLPVGKKDLQQCADAVMRLRAEFLYDQQRFREISFSDNNGTAYRCPPAPNEAAFERYLEKVYAHCGTLSLEKQLHAVRNTADIQPGDVWIKGGSPGHAVIVLDVAIDLQGKKIYLLAQSYMPAQDIHILRNPGEEIFSPWYALRDDDAPILTPEWTFYSNQLRRW